MGMTMEHAKVPILSNKNRKKRKEIYNRYRYLGITQDELVCLNLNNNIKNQGVGAFV